MIKHIFTIGLFFLFIGCQTTPQLTALQRRALQTRLFENTSYNTVFRAVKTVMQDEGYIIKNQDFKGGLIVAESQKNPLKSMHPAAAITLGVISGLAQINNPSYRRQPYKTGQVFSWSVNLEEVRQNIVEARLILQKKDYYSQGGQQGNEILDPEVYRNIFIKLRKEVARRKAMKRN